jgi:hypothetical protein
MSAADLHHTQRKWFAACREGGLDAEARKDFQAANCGKASAADMSVADFNACLIALAKRGVKTPARAVPAARRRQADSPHAKKARALWISLHHLGVIDDAGESALAAFVKRQHGVDDLRFVRPDAAAKIIDGLKAMAVRAGVNWKAHANPALCVALAQWSILTKSNARPAADLAAHTAAITGAASAICADAAQLNALIRDLGERIRQVKS